MSRFTLVVKPWDYLDVSRTFVLSGRHTLWDLHAAIQRAFEFDGDHMHAFFLNAHVWDREFGYYSDPDPGQKGSQDPRLDALGLVENKRFVYLFDFGDDHRFDVRVLAILSNEEGPENPELTSSEGTAPKQYANELEEDEDEDEDEESGEGDATEGESEEPDAAWRDLIERVDACIAGEPEGSEGDDWTDDDWMDDEDTQEGGPDEAEDDEAEDDEAEDAPPRLPLVEQVALANEILDRVKENEAVLLEQVAKWVDGDVLNWLVSLPLELEDAEDAEAALAWPLAQRLSKLPAGEMLEASMPRWAVMAGERERAIELIESNQRKYPQDPEVLLELGIAWDMLNDAQQAEPCYREALRFAGSDEELRKTAREALLGLLEQSGRTVEARQVELGEARWQKRFGASPMFGVGAASTVRNAAPKIGRNDPCPCGSGKKYKKCCGAAA